MLQAFVRTVWTICKKDVRVWLRQPANVAIAVLPALALLFVDALSAGAVGRSPVALVTLDQGARGQQMAQIIHHADEQRSYHYREGADRLCDDHGPGCAGAWSR